MSHSTLVGGSTAGRLIACPASFASTLALPPSTEIASSYAEEGTFGHAVMQALMLHRKANPNICTPVQLTAYARSLTNTVFHDRELTETHIEELIEPALQALAQLEDKWDGGFMVGAVEAKVKFPKLYGAFGTADLILISGNGKKRKGFNPGTVLLVDWKFGAGVPVKASYIDSEGYLVPNSQLMFYLAAAKATLPKLFAHRPHRVAAIIQPRTDEKWSDLETVPSDFTLFNQQLSDAVDLALKPGAPRAKGEHCRWAPCKMTCPLWTGPMLDISLIQPVAPAAASGEPTAFGDYLAKAKVLADMAVMFKKEIDDQMHAYLEAGGLIPGWRLKAKTKQRQWIDEASVAKVLGRLGFKTDQIYRPKLVTFESADRTARALGVKIPDELRVAPATNETTIATVDDPAPIVNRGLVIEQFRASLGKLLTGS